MKLSISGKTQGLLRKLQSRPSRNTKDWYPKCVPEDYFVTWEKFLKTQATSDILREHGRTPLAQYYTVALFLSYLSKYTSVPKLGSEELYDPSYGRDAIRNFLIRYKLLHKLNLKYHSHDISFNAEDISWLRCVIDIQCSGVLTYKLSGRKPLDVYLSGLEPSIFKSVPNELHNDRPFGNKPARKQKLLTPKQQVLSSYGWVSLPSPDGVSLELARARYNTMLLRYSFGVPGVYPYGSEAPDSFLKNIRKKHEISARTLQ